MKKYFIFLLCFLNVLPICAQQNEVILGLDKVVTKFVDKKGNIKVEVLPESLNISGGEELRILFKLNHKNAWHTYWLNPGGPGLQTQVVWILPNGFSGSKIMFPPPKKFTSENGQIVNFGYENEEFLAAKLKIPNNLAANEKFVVNGEINWLICSNETCHPGRFKFRFDLKSVAQKETEKNNLFDSVFAKIPKNGKQNWQAFATIIKKKLKFVLIPKNKKKLGNLQAVNILPIVADFADESIAPEIFLFAEKLVVDFSLDEYYDPEEEPEMFSALVQLFYKNGSKKEFTIETEIIKAEKIPALESNKNGQVLQSPMFEEKTNRKKKKIVGGGISNIWQALLFGFLGGLILNVMPCVFPIISIKILGFVQQAGQKRGKIIFHGLIYTVGILISFLVLATIFVLAKNTLNIGWAFQLQNAYFVLACAAIFLILAMNLAGFFEFGFILASKAARLEQSAKSSGSGVVSSFASGILAVIIATPCTGPFLGPTIAYALNNSAFETYSVLSSVAIGFALPYLFFSIFPGLLKLLPISGPWMENLKKFLSIPMFLAVVWLIWVFSVLKTEKMIDTLITLMAVGTCAWLFGAVFQTARGKKRLVGGILIFILAIFSVIYGKKTCEEDIIKWQPYSNEKLQTALNNQQAVFIDFTAAWCMICQTNKKAFTSKIKQEIKKRNILLLKVDWTRKDEKILNLLKNYGRESVPLYVFYPPGYQKSGQTEPKILPNTLLPNILLECFKSEG